MPRISRSAGSLLNEFEQKKAASAAALKFREETPKMGYGSSAGAPMP